MLFNPASIKRIGLLLAFIAIEFIILSPVATSLNATEKPWHVDPTGLKVKIQSTTLPGGEHRRTSYHLLTQPGTLHNIQRSTDLKTWNTIGQTYGLGQELQIPLYTETITPEAPVEPPATFTPSYPDPVWRASVSIRRIANGDAVASWNSIVGNGPQNILLPQVNAPEDGAATGYLGEWTEIILGVGGSVLQLPPAILSEPTGQDAQVASLLRAQAPDWINDWTLGREQAAAHPSTPAPPGEKGFIRVTTLNTLDSDLDTLTDTQEFELGTDPFSPDTDGDGTSDAEEIAYGTNPSEHAMIADGDEDGITDDEDADPSNPSITWRKVSSPTYIHIPIPDPFIDTPYQDQGTDTLTLTNQHTILATKDRSQLWIQENTSTEDGSPPAGAPPLSHYHNHHFAPGSGWSENLPLPAHLRGTATDTTKEGNILGTGLLALPFAGPGAHPTVIQWPLDGTNNTYTDATSVAPAANSATAFSEYTETWTTATNPIHTFASTSLPGTIIHTHTPFDQYGPTQATQQIWFTSPILNSPTKLSETHNQLNTSALTVTPHGWIGITKTDQNGTNTQELFQIDPDTHATTTWPTPDTSATLTHLTAIQPSLSSSTTAPPLIWKTQNTTYTSAIDENQALTWNITTTLPQGKLNARGEFAQDTHLWRNAKQIPVNDLIDIPETTLTNILAHNDHGAILAQDSTQNKHLLLPLEIISRDRLLAGSLHIPEAWKNKITLTFTHKNTGENLGSHILGDSQDHALIYPSVENIYDDQELADIENDTLDPRATTQQVTFARKKDAPDTIEFYTTFADTGDIQITLSIGEQNLGTLDHTLTPEPHFANIIDKVDDTITDPAPFNATTSQNTQNPISIDPRTTRSIISLLSTTGLVQADIAESIITGAIDGFLAGIRDDWALIQLLQEGAILLIDNLGPALEAELNRWQEDPDARALVIARKIHAITHKLILEPIAASINAVQHEGQEIAKSGYNLQNYFFGLVLRNQDKIATAGMLMHDTSETILKALDAWLIDFSDRMYEGAEKTHFAAITSSPAGKWRHTYRTFFYGASYSLGYITEQLFLGKNIGILVKGIAKTGATVLAKTLPHVKRHLARTLPFLYKLWAKTDIPDDLAGNILDTHRKAKSTGPPPLPGTTKTTPTAELIDEWIELQNLTKINSATILTEINKAPRLKLLLASHTHRRLFLEQCGSLTRTLGPELTEDAMTGFIRTFDRLLKTENGTTFTNRTEDLLKLFKAETTGNGKVALRESLETFKTATDSNPNAIFWMKRADQVHSSCYHHFPTSGFNRISVRNGKAYLTANTGDRGWYVTSKQINDQALAKDQLQLPLIENGRYRCEFATTQAKDHLKLPRGNQNLSEIFEPLTRDFPNLGSGGAEQLLLDNKEVLLDSIFDCANGRYLSIDEIKNLITL